MTARGGNVKQGLSLGPTAATNPAMNEPKPTRDERLAAKLRENLRRRKAQARELGGPADSPDLPKAPPSR